MPEINVKVKVRGGKRTRMEIFAESAAINKREIRFVSGRVLSDKELEPVIFNAIEKFLNI